MLIGAIITFTATKFSADTDVVFRFYNKFNPCILWDHEPAATVCTVLVSIWMLVDCIFMLQIQCINFSLDDWGVDMYGNALVMVVIGCNLMFPAEMTTDLYEGGYRSGVLDDAELYLVTVHSMFYFFWLVGQLLCMYYVIRILDWTVYRHSTSTKWWVGNGVPRWLSVLFGFFGFAVLLFCAKVAIKLLYGEEYKNRPKEQVTFVYAAVRILEKQIQSDLWHWLPIVSYKLFIGKKLAVQFHYRVEYQKKGRYGRIAPSSQPSPDNRGVIDPEQWICQAHRLIALMCYGAFLFQDPKKDTVPFLSAFRTAPYSFVFIPFWLLYCLMMLIGLRAAFVRDAAQMALGERERTIGQQRLDRIFSNKTQYYLRCAVSVIWLCSIVMMAITVRRKALGLAILTIIWACCVPLWAILSVGLSDMIIAFSVVWISLFIGSLYSYVTAFFMLMLMSSFHFFVDDPWNLVVEKMTVTGMDYDFITDKEQEQQEQSQQNIILTDDERSSRIDIQNSEVEVTPIADKREAGQPEEIAPA
eukprot:gb/GEZN01004984.1/.p1 GENE.gb/GEZN01004984.1/~~gb/GEZN01004984.1/.p1  ORF type:complete len:578 (+),score=31.45 gb/GEZN01004984.1/:153-1736(+)